VARRTTSSTGNKEHAYFKKKKKKEVYFSSHPIRFPFPYKLGIHFRLSWEMAVPKIKQLHFSWLVPRALYENFRVC
jgi:hypothetical protein